MKVVDAFENEGQSMFYTVALEPGFLVDVKACYETGLVYVMQNEDGSTVYEADCPEHTFPDFKFDEEEVVRFIKAIFINKDSKEMKPAFDDMVARAATRMQQQARQAMNELDKQFSFIDMKR